MEFIKKTFQQATVLTKILTGLASGTTIVSPDLNATYSLKLLLSSQAFDWGFFDTVTGVTAATPTTTTSTSTTTSTTSTSTTTSTTSTSTTTSTTLGATPLFGFVNLATGFGKSINGGITWNNLLLPYNGVDQNFLFTYGAQAIDVNNIVVSVGDEGVIYTTDSGDTWAHATGVGIRMIEMGGIQGSNVVFVNDSTGNGVLDVIMKSIDGGKTFASVENYASIVTTGKKNLSAIASRGNRVVATFEGNNPNENYLITSTDGGVTWVNRSGTHTDTINLLSSGLNLPDDNTIYYVDYGDDFLYKSINFGETWSKTSVHTAGNLRVIDFKTANLGIIVNSDGTNIEITEDGGATWTVIDGLPVEGIFVQEKPHIASATEFWVAGRNTSLENRLSVFYTNDGGNNWSQHDFNDSAGLIKFNFIY